jgi:hypothetical protein
MEKTDIEDIELRKEDSLEKCQTLSTHPAREMEHFCEAEMLA